MKAVVAFLAIAVCGTSALSIPALAWFNSTAQKAVSATHKVSGQTIDLVDSTNQAAAELAKDVSQTNTLWLEDGYDKMGDKTKDAIKLAQEKTNQLLDIVGQWGGPLKVGAHLGSKVTNLTANTGKTLANVGIGAAQLGTAMGNQAFGATVDKMAQVSSGIAGKATAANDMGAHLASAGINKVVGITSTLGKGVGSAIQALGQGVLSWSSLPSSENPDPTVEA